MTINKVIIYESDINNRQQKFDEEIGKLKLIPGIFSKDLNYLALLFSVICDELKNPSKWGRRRKVKEVKVTRKSLF